MTIIGGYSNVCFAPRAQTSDRARKMSGKGQWVTFEFVAPGLHLS
jgi:hypothetical protein